MATTTPNFGWDIPQSTDLVKDGATAIAALGTDIDTSLVDLKGGTTGQVLSKASNTDMDFTWVAQDDSNAIQNALLTTTGDTIYASSASTPARLGIGSSGQSLTVSGGLPTWQPSPTSVMTTTGDLLYASAANTLARRAIGTTGQVLTVTGGVPTWETPAGFSPSFSVVETAQTRTGSGFANLGTTQSITITTGTKALIWGSYTTSNTSITSNYQGIAVSGATTISAFMTSVTRLFAANNAVQVGFIYYFSTLTAGSNTFTFQWGSDAGTAEFQYRRFAAVSL